MSRPYQRIVFDNGDTTWTGPNTQTWRINGKLHRENGPAIYDPCAGIEIWCSENNIHREDGPAYISKYGHSWYLHGMLHRTNGPAHITSTGNQIWWRNGKLWPEGRQIYLREVAMALLPLELPAYIVLWILEFVVSDINEAKMITFLQGIKDTRRRIKN